MKRKKQIKKKAIKTEGYRVRVTFADLHRFGAVGVVRWPLKNFFWFQHDHDPENWEPIGYNEVERIKKAK